MTTKTDIFILRGGPESQIDGVLSEPTIATDTFKLVLKAANDTFMKIPSNLSTGDFAWNENLIHLNFTIGAGSKINNTEIGQAGRSKGSFTEVILDNGANNTPILQWRSSSVLHNHADFSGNSVYGFTKRYDPVKGGLHIVGGANGDEAMVIEGYAISSDVDTDQTPEATSIISLIGTMTTNGTVVNMASTENLLGIYKKNANGSKSAVAFMDAGGNISIVGESSQIVADDYDDVRLLAGLRGILGGHKSNFIKQEDIQYALAHLPDIGVIKVSEEGKLQSSNQTGIILLLIDAVRQLSARIEKLESGHKS